MLNKRWYRCEAVRGNEVYRMRKVGRGETEGVAKLSRREKVFVVLVMF